MPIRSYGQIEGFIEMSHYDTGSCQYHSLFGLGSDGGGPRVAVHPGGSEERQKLYAIERLIYKRDFDG